MDLNKITAMATVIKMLGWALDTRDELRGDISDLAGFLCDKHGVEVDHYSVMELVDEYLEKFRDSVYAELPPCPNGHSPRPKLDS
ncbi:hypothetical protein SEA_Maroc7_72 [Mycobacterium phage Maroc7]|nr:hypothetical protein SEA_Maroc7_72 [Mycobacterium phage Maroc7]